MWKRDVLFVGLVAVGLLGLVTLLVPDRPQTSAAAATSAASAASSATDLVAEIDAVFHTQWAQQHVAPAAAADDELVARRAALALVGTIPSLEELRLLESLPAETRRAAWVDHLLADLRSSEYLAERLARAFVGTDAGPFLVYRRRRFVTWLSDQLYENRPYDALVRALIASDGLWTDQPATNFVTAAIVPDSDEGVDEARLVSRVARAFLGSRIDCAQCHDHFFADWKQTDFQGLAAYFGQTQQTFTGIRDVEGEFQLHDPATDKMITVEPAVPFARELLPESGYGRQRLAQWVTHPENKAFARATVNRFWAIMFDRPLIAPIDDLPLEGGPAVLDLLAADFVERGYDVRRLLRVIALSEVFGLESRAADDAENLADENYDAWAAFPLTRLRSEQVVRAVMQAASLRTIDHESNIIVRLATVAGQNEFVRRYGDAGDAEFEPRPGTIPQRLLLMNGELVDKRTRQGIGVAASRIARLAPDDTTAVDTAYRVILTRLPTDAEREYFVERLSGTTGGERIDVMTDLYWALVNSTEFSWNH